MEQLIDRIVKAPWPVKIGAVVGVIVVATVATFFLLISPTNDEIKRIDDRLKKLEGEFIDKQQIANNLNQYRREKEILEQRLAEALTELPNERAIDDLLRQLHDVGEKSGLEIVSVEPGSEQPDQFYAKIPITMRVTGNYHEIAVFFDAVGKLKRIVNINNIELKNPKPRNEKMVVEGTYLATTFRFRPEAAKAADDAKGKKGAKAPDAKGGGK